MITEGGASIEGVESKIEEIFQKVKNSRMENSRKSEENWKTNSGGPISKQDFKKT